MNENTDVSSESNYSLYGKYTITDSLDLKFPNNQIRFEKVSSKVFSYIHASSYGKTTEKIIPTDSAQIDIEVCPIRPLNHPARRTNSVFLQFDREIFLPESSAATVFVQCPIEIGIFLIHEGITSSLDWMTCDPTNSRFGLYGKPDSGVLCKYSEVKIVGSLKESIPYINGVMKILLKNDLSRGHTVGKVIFPITDNSIYYEDDQAIFDGIVAELKRRVRVDVVEINEEKIETDWALSPTLEPTTSKTHMEMGLE